KAFELLDLIGWEHAATVLPAVVGELVQARGGEEMDAWRHPVDLAPALRGLGEELPGLLQAGAGRQWQDGPALGQVLLGDDPLHIIGALREAVGAGAQPEQLSQRLAHAAAL